jgi:hypothetical protein
MHHTYSSCQRQHYCCGIYKQTGRYPFMGARRSTLAHTYLVSSEGHLSDLQTRSRLTECHSRHTVKRGQTIHTECSLHPQVFQEICQLQGTPMIELCNWVQQVDPVCVTRTRPKGSAGGLTVHGHDRGVYVCVSLTGLHSSWGSANLCCLQDAGWCYWPTKTCFLDQSTLYSIVYAAVPNLFALPYPLQTLFILE